jgi:hypothetical protein
MCFLATLLVALVAGCGQETVSIPGVVSVTPAQGATGVVNNTTVTATFNMAMNPATITTSTFTLTSPGGVAVAGTVSYSGMTATFTPSAVLAYGTTYTATITTGASSPGGAELVSNYVWTFSTVAPSVPSVVINSVTPPPFAQNVPITGAGAIISATFSQAMIPASTDAAFTVEAPGGVVVPGAASLSTNGLVATFTPTSGTLAYSTTYTATITTGATSLSEGIPLAGNYVWTFTTITPPPTVTVVPVDTAIGVPVTQILTATFSEAMNCATLNPPANNFTLTTGTPAVTVQGTVACSGNVATFTPNSNLAYNTVYQATISAAVQDPAAQPIPFTQWSFLTAPAPIPLPTVMHTVPITVSPAPFPIVAANSSISATFSEAMTPDTLNSATFLLTVTGGAAVNGVITYAPGSDTATFAPIGGLAYNTGYTATITTGAEDYAGGGLAQNYTWQFTVGAPLTSAPYVTSTIPVTPSTTVPEDVTVPPNQVISATFSEPMDPATIIGSNFTLTYLTVPGNVITPVSGLVAYSGISNELVFVPSAKLLPNTTYTATITTGVEDLAGQHLVSQTAHGYVWIFQTGAAVNFTPPELLSVVPLSGATGVPITQAVSATFSEGMNALTLTPSTFQLFAGKDVTGTQVDGSYQYDPVTFIATFTPANPLAASAYYTATVTSGAQSLAGIGLGDTGPVGPPPNTWTFMTGTTTNQAPVLGPTIAAFGGFAGSAGMTNTGLTTVIHGDSGTTATGFSSYTGFHDETVLVAGIPQCVYTETGSNVGEVTGTIYSPLVVPPPFACPDEGSPADIATATAALDEATTAYTTLQGLPVTTSVPLAGQLAGTTIYPGVYKNSSSVLITGGDVKLDAQGDPNAYWVFQIGSSLTVGDSVAPSSVMLLNGAKAKNVYWAVGTDVYLEPSGGGVFNGTIIASDFIHVSTVSYVIPVIVNGRLISLNASTTLVDTVINVPAP